MAGPGPGFPPIRYAGHPGYIAGRFYVADEYVSAAGAALGPTQVTFGLLSVHQRIVVDQLGIRITTVSAGGSFSLALYDRDPATGRATARRAQSAAPGSTAAAAAVNTALDAAVTLEPGAYYVGFMVDNATAIALANSGAGYGGASKFGDPTEAIGPGITSQIPGLFLNMSYGAWPADLSGQDLLKMQQTKIPIVQFRVAAVL